MTIRELALNLIENASDATPTVIDMDRAKEIIGWLDPENLPEDLTPEAFMETFNDIIKEGETTMETTLYTAIIETEDGIHIFRKAISDPTAEYEDFEIEMDNKADDLDGEVLCIYAPEDIVEDTTLD